MVGIETVFGHVMIGRVSFLISPAYSLAKEAVVNVKAIYRGRVTFPMPTSHVNKRSMADLDSLLSS